MTYTEAIDAIFTKFRSTWIDGRVLALLGYDTETRWPGILKENAPVSNRFWVRVSQQTVLERQQTLSSCEGLPGKRRFRTHGLVMIQLFCPRSVERSVELGRKLAIIARDAFRGKTAGVNGDIWFYRARIQDNIPPEQEVNRFNVVAEYEYDELA